MTACRGGFSPVLINVKSVLPTSNSNYGQMTSKKFWYYVGTLTYFYHNLFFLKVAHLVGEKGIQKFHTKNLKKKNLRECGGMVKA